ncbi:hypothetical protein AMTR_s00009p00261870 [Amborella trichopoda]|uniref:Serine-threonine/tyrosine-protein kinase catalytic domain-containing protein n=1 Tax=Amborella trichopoda TaxID=13333 RepID=W1NI58_AMBTC|nr:hypothetical protein AMTR_s00009p00261870 [Amborella trichopoda]
MTDAKNLRQTLALAPLKALFSRNPRPFVTAPATNPCPSLTTLCLNVGYGLSDNLVGKVGYAEVYKGVLKDGQEISLKRLTQASSDEQKEKEFLTELGTIGHICHPNVSSLIGCCIDNGLHLIFEFSAHGCVSTLLHDFRLRISEMASQWTHHSVTPIEDTFGYLAPEYFMQGIVDEKTDAFAFGVFLLEAISGRKPVNGSQLNLFNWAQLYLEAGDIHSLADPRLQGQYDVQQLDIKTMHPCALGLLPCGGHP